MEIVVCLKQVPARDAALRLNAAGTWIESLDASPEMNEPDAYALEEALRLKERHGGAVTAISAGPPEAASVLREALAKGADAAVLIESEDFRQADPLATARALAAAIQRKPYDLALTGLQSDDAGFGQTGVVLAEALGRAARGHRRRDRGPGRPPHGPTGARSRLDPEARDAPARPVDDPIGHQQGPLRDADGHQEGPLQAFGADSGNGGSASVWPTQRIAKLYPPRKSKQTQRLEGSAKAQAEALVEKLRFEARVL